MATVTMIPAKRRVGNTAVKAEEKPKLKVAAYCRVSTDSDEQATSYEAQVEHYTEFIEKNSEWELAGIYADDGISGTNTKKREDFNRMIDDCNAGKIDMIITKSISRFARNTLDCLKYIRELKDLNIPVFFEKENINTMDAKGEVLLTIMASLAQQESQSLSQNVKLGYQFRYQSGQMTVNHNRFMGFTKDDKGQLIVDEEEAKIVKRIFREYLEGSSLLEIGKGLEADGILTGAGKPRWRPETIKKMLSNEKYIGDALLQKTYTVDFLTKKRVKNEGIVPQYYVENSHEAIIPRDLFMQVQEEMIRRANLHSGEERKKRVYSSKYALSSIVYCPKCGEIYRRIAWNNRGKHSIVWRCCTRVEHGPKACDADTIQESELQEMVVKAINRVVQRSDTTMPILKKNIEIILDVSGEAAIEAIDQRLLNVQKELTQKALNHQDYGDLTNKVKALMEEKQQAQIEKANRTAEMKRVQELVDLMEAAPAEMTEYDEALTRQLIEKITIYDDHMQFEFKAGITIDIER